MGPSQENQSFDWYDSDGEQTTDQPALGDFDADTDDDDDGQEDDDDDGP